MRLKCRHLVERRSADDRRIRSRQPRRHKAAIKGACCVRYEGDDLTLAVVRNGDARPIGIERQVRGHRIAKVLRSFRKVQRQRINGRAIQNHTGLRLVPLRHVDGQFVATLNKLYADRSPRERIGPGMGRTIPLASAVVLSPAVRPLRPDTSIHARHLHMPDMEGVGGIFCDVLENHALVGKPLDALRTVLDPQSRRCRFLGSIVPARHSSSNNDTADKAEFQHRASQHPLLSWTRASPHPARPKEDAHER